MKSESRRNESGLPLGGIGAGKIEFCPDGRFTNVTTNNWDCPIVDSFAATPMMPRIKEGFAGSIGENADRRRALYRPEGVPGAWLAAYAPVDGARVLKACARPAFQTLSEDAINFQGRFPIASVSHPAFNAIALELSAFSSFMIPDFSPEYRDSVLPVALFVFNVTNRTDTALPVGLAMSWQNLNGVGGYAGHPINQPDPTPPKVRTGQRRLGLWFDHDPQSTADPRVLGNYTLTGWCARADVDISTCAGWDPHGAGNDVWESLSERAALNGLEGAGAAGALAIHCVLEPGERTNAVFALAWYMPHLLAAETVWTNLIRPSSAPLRP